MLEGFRLTGKYVFTLLLSNKQHIQLGEFHLGGTPCTYRIRSCLVLAHPGWYCRSHFMRLAGIAFVPGHYKHGLRTILTMMIFGCLLHPQIPCILYNTHVWSVALNRTYSRRKVKIFEEHEIGRHVLRACASAGKLV